LKKTTRALYCAAAGLALLASTGGGTYASWVGSTNLVTTTNTIDTGDLSLTFRDGSRNGFNQVSWSLNGGPGTYDFSKIGEVKPGNVLIGTAWVRVTLKGDTMHASLSHGNLVPSVTGNSPALLGWLQGAANTAVVTIAPEGQADETWSLPLALSPNSVGYADYKVSVKITFPTTGFPAATTSIQSANFHMGDLDLTLIQTTSGSPFTG
jgi:alternate signal-mediated exported protein